MAQSRGKSRGMVKVALSALLAACGALLSATGCSSEVSEGTGGSEDLGVVRQPLLCLNPSTGGKIECGSDTDCRVVKCSKIGNGCEYTPINDGAECKNSNGLLGVCAAAVCCTGCVRVNKLTREVTCEKGTNDENCGRGGKECDSCSDGLCTTSTCNAEKGQCDAETLPDKAPCNDGSGLCLKGSCCRGCVNKQGVCVAGTSVNECGKTTPQSGFAECQNCDQGNVCSNYACTNGVCAAPTPKPGTCADNTVCNGQEVCGDNQCKPGTPLVCDDGNVCTDDECDAVDGCKYTNNTANCSDNNLCTVTDKCSGGSCKGTGAPNCDDNNPCTDDDCDPALGCVHTPKANNTPCDDGNECSTGDRCVDGKCLASGGKLCDDDKSCTKNTCDPSNQECTYPNEEDGTPCIHTNKCVQNSTCQSGTCNAGPEIVCDDGNPCTKDDCDEAVGCVFTPDDSATCSDGDACTSDDTCNNGKCEGTPVACAALDECHVPGTCNPTTGKCDDPRADDGTECNEGGPGTCDAGKCVLLPVGGAGNEGGAPSGAGGAPAEEGGAPAATGGQGDPGVSGSGASPGSDAGAPGDSGTERDRPFVRQPGGCSCRVPSDSSGSHSGRGALLLAGLALAGAVARRRRPAA